MQTKFLEWLSLGIHVSCRKIKSEAENVVLREVYNCCSRYERHYPYLIEDAYNLFAMQFLTPAAKVHFAPFYMHLGAMNSFFFLNVQAQYIADRRRMGGDLLDFVSVASSTSSILH